MEIHHAHTLSTSSGISNSFAGVTRLQCFQGGIAQMLAVVYGNEVLHKY